MQDINIPSQLLRALQEAERVTLLTGAGISAESGVPTFREAQTGLWAKYDPQQLATPAAFEANPRLVWEWYEWRRELIGNAAPNPGHYALAIMEQHVPHFTLITQNVDNLHQEAGTRGLLELHGNIHRIKCFVENLIVDEWEKGEEVPPRCPRCHGLLRPDVVWFGEALPREALAAAVIASRNAELFFSVGTSAMVHPAAALPLEAVEHRALTVEINPEETPVTMWMDYALHHPAGEILPALVRAAWPD